MGTFTHGVIGMRTASSLVFASFLGTSAVRAHPLLSSSSLSLGARAPQTDGVSNPVPSNDDSGGNSGGDSLPVAVWAPLIIVPLVFIVVMVFFRGRLLPKIASFGQGIFGQSAHPPIPSRSRNNSRANLNAPSGPRVLTADQLAGSNATNENAARREGGDAAAAPPRRRRRPRRTPSQVSTRSLPAYMAEPGAQEFVLARAQEDPAEEDEHDEEDEEEAEEDATRTPLLDQSMTTASSGSSIPQHDVNHQRSGSHPSIRPSMDSGMSSHESHNTNRSSMNLLDVRGEAPPYFEVVGDGPTIVNPDNEESERRDEFQPAPPSGPPSSFRMPTALKRFFPWGAQRAQPQPPLLPMQQTNATQVSLAQSVSPTSPNRNRRHSQARLSSPSLASLHILSRSRSNLNQNPEASASRSNISGPLPHSLIRTSFSYPTGGATPEQVAFLSSTASLLRFGVPINEDGTEDLRRPPNFADIVPTAAAGSNTTLSPAEPGESPTTRPRSNSAGSGNSVRAPLSVSTGNLTSVQEQPTPISPAIEGLPSSSGAANMVARAAFVPLPPSAATFAPERVPLPEESHVDEFGFGYSEGLGSGGMRGRISGASANTYATADTHMTDDTEMSVATAMDRTPVMTNAALPPPVAPIS